MSEDSNRTRIERDSEPADLRPEAVQPPDSVKSGLQAGRLLPLLVVAVGAYFLLTGMQGGTLRAAVLKPVNGVGLALTLASAALALIARKPIVKLAGVLLCGIGAILVICI